MFVKNCCDKKKVFLLTYSKHSSAEAFNPLPRNLYELRKKKYYLIFSFKIKLLTSSSKKKKFYTVPIHLFVFLIHSAHFIRLVSNFVPIKHNI